MKLKEKASNTPEIELYSSTMPVLSKSKSTLKKSHQEITTLLKTLQCLRIPISEHK